jgi:hypothetical protein
MSPLTTHLENLTVVADDAPLNGASGTLHIDSGDEFEATTGPTAVCRSRWRCSRSISAGAVISRSAPMGSARSRDVS